MASDKPPLVLLHPILISGRIWHDVIPYLSSHHQVYNHTLLGHRGGPPVQRHPTTIVDVVDAAEQYLDDHRLERPHLVGNSAGGFVAIELARRGRATTVCALSPAGFWSTEDGSWDRAANRARRVAAMCRLVHPVAPLIFRSAIVRRLALRSINIARRADRVAAARAVEAVEDSVACTVTVDEVFSTDDGKIAPLDPLPCPITLAWSEKDSLVPVATYGEIARERLPQATFEVLPDVGHVPMFDDPELVARTILAVIGAAKK
ncbi:MAG: alpha/beta fold hydrolase [Mycobacterium sp.]|uniref:alpha/beta fold hydrolase n=1 Tax=Mycobacterium sp. TaxID=1785 RepID=UPI003F9A11F3